MKRKMTDLQTRTLKEFDSIRICNLYQDILSLSTIPEITKECIIVIRDENGIDYQSNIGDLCEFIKSMKKEI